MHFANQPLGVVGCLGLEGCPLSSPQFGLEADFDAPQLNTFFKSVEAWKAVDVVKVGDQFSWSSSLGAAELIAVF
jgi:hypothetical protein